MTKLTTQSDPLPISHRSRSAGGQLLIPLMGRPSDRPPILCQRHFGDFLLIFSAATYVRRRPSHLIIQIGFSRPSLDGYRAIAVIDSTGKARLWSRNRLPLELKFGFVREAVGQLKLRSTILDREIVALDKKGSVERLPAW
jgi:hypothetical protein